MSKRVSVRGGSLFARGPRVLRATPLFSLLLGVCFACLAAGCMDKLPEASLHEAIELEDLDRVAEMLAKGADPEEQNSEGSPALHVAATLGFANIGLELLAYDASARSVDAEKRTPLHLASRGPDMARLCIALIERGADVNARDSKGQTPLFGNVDRHVASILVNNGADVKARDDAGLTPLHSASGHQRGGTMDVLIAHGADVNAADHLGQTPLHVAVLDPSAYLTNTLLEHGANIDTQDQDGFTPLHVAAERGKRRIVMLLIEAGANLDLVDAKGRTPADLATAADRASIARGISSTHGQRRRTEALRRLQLEAEAAETANAANATNATNATNAAKAALPAPKGS